MSDTQASTRAHPTATRGVEVSEPSVVFEHVSFAFDDHMVLDDISFEIPAGRMKVLLGASGSGKSVVLKLLLGLLRPDAGQILVHGHRVDSLSEQELSRVRADVGIAFQENALFDSLTVNENVGYRLYEETRMPLDDVRRRVEEVLSFVGMRDYIERMPSELSGGQRRRVGIARAMAARPKLLLFDDPTTGLDPITAAAVDDEIVKLRDTEQVTALLVTHQIRDAVYIATHAARYADERLHIDTASAEKAAETSFMVLHEGRIFFEGSESALFASADPFLKEFLYKTLPPW